MKILKSTRHGSGATAAERTFFIATSVTTGSFEGRISSPGRG